MRTLESTHLGIGPAPLVDAADGLFDVAVIGAGVVGCAVARRFALAGARVAVIEKGADILSGASKANSAILHTGFDAPPNSLELELVKRGRAEYLEIADELNLPLVKTGALVCAWDDEQEDFLQEIEKQSKLNGVENIGIISAKEARASEPYLSTKLVRALEVPDEHVIDPWSAPLAYLSQAVALGTVFIRNAELTSASFKGAEWSLETTAGIVRSSMVVNAAGLYGDKVDERLGFESEFQIKPRKGQFVVLDKAASQFVSRIILPVPTAITKGILACPTAFGNVLIGPTAEEQDDRVRATVEQSTLEMLLDKAKLLVPSLSGISVTAVYAGLRPATEEKGYRVIYRPESKALTLGGIRSTGLSAALGLAQHAFELLGHDSKAELNAPSYPKPFMPNLAECRTRDWQQSDHGEIVCHCELVTRREIEATFQTLVPPGDFGGLRRRTRAGMGRCQGFYCNAALASISQGKLEPSLTVSVNEAK